ncbi:HEAT repeat domain-containing protein [Bacillus rubiinfantis]|uniref:HEAT repeat domain-containing protein n=1 Tax=Bacillus rubiinfantis TaxID=1499680 RepID=UPI0005AB18C0|nr:HEAT repeat domain-containing protein [Bacillus rubiinfantis]
MNTEQKIKKIKELQKRVDENSIEKIGSFLEDDDTATKLTAIEVLGELPKDESIKSILIKLTENPDEEIRFYALESLHGYTGEDVYASVVKRLEDSDELVRISAVEVIVNLKDIKGIEHLCNALTDTDEIVRSYAAEGIGKIGTKTYIPILEKYLSREKSNLSKLGFFLGLYLLGEKKYLNSILALLENRSYRVRCAVANSVVDLVNQENIKQIKERLLSALKNERTNAAHSTLEGALEEINSLNLIQ